METQEEYLNGAQAKTHTKRSFQQLVRALSDVLGPCSGLDSEEIDPHDLQEIMETYTSDETEWARYAFFDCSRSYTRNLVDEGNGKSNLLILVWTPGKRSPIHDHANAHCVMKVRHSQSRNLSFPPSHNLTHALPPSRY